MSPKLYSDEYLEVVRYLLTVEDPLEEARYFSGLNALTAEPSETLAIVRNAAYEAVAEFEDGGSESVREDALVVDVELAIQRRKLRELNASQARESRVVVVAGIVALGALVSVARGFDAGPVVNLALVLGSLVFAISIASSFYYLWRERPLKRVVGRLERARRGLSKAPPQSR